MNQQATTAITSDQADAIAALDHLSVELINQADVKVPDLGDARKNAEENFRIVNQYLNTLKRAATGFVYDCSTTQGDKFARDMRLRLVTLRTRTEKLRKAADKPHREQIEANKAVSTIVEDAVAPLEKAADDAIKAAERAAEERKRQEAEEAAARDRAITERLQRINELGQDLIGHTAAKLAELEQEARAIDVAEAVFGARFSEAVSAKDRAIQKIGQAHGIALQSEENERTAKAQREQFERERAEHHERQAAELKARTAIAEDITALLDGLTGAPAANIEKRLERLAGFNAEHYAPLQADAQTAHDRVKANLQEAATAKRTAESEAIAEGQRQQRAAAEQRARDAIQAVKNQVAAAVGAPAADIAEAIADIEGLKAADFDPLGADAAKVQEETLTKLRALHAAAVTAEQTDAERKAAAARAANAESAINGFAGTAARLEASGAASTRIAVVLDDLRKVNLAEAGFDTRQEEGERVIAEQIEKLVALHAERVNQEVAAEREKAEAARIESERQAEEQRRADERAKQSRLEAAQQRHAAAMHELLLHIHRGVEMSDVLTNEVANLLDTIAREAE